MHCHAHIANIAVPSAVLMASLIGSGHCAFMCGGLVAASSRTVGQQFFYHAGRLASYMVLGGISGWAGSNIMTKLPSGLSEVMAWMIALSFIVLGIASWKSGSWHIALPGTAAVNRWVVRIFGRLTELSQAGRAYYSCLVGALSIFLPCGWLYSFVLASASIASPWKGAFIMGVFWAGTLPALAVSPWILKKVFSLADGVAPKVSSLLLIAAGIVPILLRYLRFL